MIYAIFVSLLMMIFTLQKRLQFTIIKGVLVSLIVVIVLGFLMSLCYDFFLQMKLSPYRVQIFSLTGNLIIPIVSFSHNMLSKLNIFANFNCALIIVVYFWCSINN